MPGAADKNIPVELVVAEPHDAFNACSIVPLRSKITISDAAGKWGKISLNVHLRLFALRRRRQGDHAECARAHPLHQGLDHAAFAGAVPPLEDNANLFLFVDDPLLELHKFNLKPLKLPLVVFRLQLSVAG